MFNAIILFIGLFVTWIILSGHFTPFFIIMGFASCLATVYLSKKLYEDKGEVKNLLDVVINTSLYFPWLLKEIVKSSMDVTMRIWQIEPDISPDTAWITTKLDDDIGLTIFANSITLTPGTVTISVRPGAVHVHALTKAAIRDLKGGEMSGRVAGVVKE